MDTVKKYTGVVHADNKRLVAIENGEVLGFVHWHLVPNTFELIPGTAEAAKAALGWLRKKE